MTRRFTTADLDNLRDGTTPGPWRIDSSDPDWPQLVGPVVWEGNLITQEILTDLGELSDPNLRLAAAAPELAAELHRIRTELEEWLQDEQALIESMDPANPVDQILIVGAQSSIKSITRILEGGHR